MLITDIQKADALFFDMDGTIIHSEPLHFEAIIESCEHFHFELPKDQDLASKYCGWTDTNLLIDLFPTADRSKIDEIVKLKGSLLLKIMETKFRKELVIPGFYEFFSWAKSANKKTALVTASEQDATEKTLTQMGVINDFDIIVTRKSTPQSKPTPMPYLYALEQLRLTPEQVIVFEDSRPGVQSARAAGLKIIQQNATTKREFDDLPSVGNYFGLIPSK